MALAHDIVNHPRSRHRAIGTLNLHGVRRAIRRRSGPTVHKVVGGITRLIIMGRGWFCSSAGGRIPA